MSSLCGPSFQATLVPSTKMDTGQVHCLAQKITWIRPLGETCI